MVSQRVTDLDDVFHLILKDGLVSLAVPKVEHVTKDTPISSDQCDQIA
jgi:hypothetical protein